MTSKQTGTAEGSDSGAHWPATVASLAVGAAFFATVRVGFRMDGTRNARADCSAEEAGCGGVLPIRAQPDVLGVLRGLDRAVGGFRTGKPARNRGGVRNCAGREFLCAVI